MKTKYKTRGRKVWLEANMHRAFSPPWADEIERRLRQGFGVEDIAIWMNCHRTWVEQQVQTFASTATLQGGGPMLPKRSYRSLELPIHRAVLHYLQLTLPGALIHHSPQNLGVKGDGVARAVALAKSMGMLVGFPDLLVIYRGRTMGFEVKADAGVASEAQRGLADMFEANGARYAEVRSIDEVKAAMTLWGVI